MGYKGMDFGLQGPSLHRHVQAYALEVSNGLACFTRFKQQSTFPIWYVRDPRSFLILQVIQYALVKRSHQATVAKTGGPERGGAL